MGRVGSLSTSVADVAVRYADDPALQAAIADPSIGQDVGTLLSRVVQLVEADRIAALADRTAWKTAWLDQRDATGRSYWDGYEDARQDVLAGNPDRYVSGPRSRSGD